VTSIAWACTIDIMNINDLYAEFVNKILCSFISNIFIDCIGQLATWAELSHSVIKVKAVCALAQLPRQQMIAHRPKHV